MINLGQLLNIKQELAINSIDRNCAQVVQHAMQRRASHLPGQVMSGESFAKAYPEASAILQKTSSGIAEKVESVNKKRKLNE